jgi:predicted SnoaL-like aldol condensation-catalyzing enzyme
MGGNACISKTALTTNTLAPTTSRDRTRSQSFSLLATSFEFGICVYPNTRGEIKRVFAEGDHVILHCHYTGFFGKNGDAIIDIFRVDAGKVVEHWDVIQAIPDSSLNDNTMF